MRTSRRLAVGGLALLVACGDNGSGGARSASEFVQFDEVFERTGRIRLEENDTVVTVVPTVAVDSTGSFLVVDGREAQVRMYGPDGNLRAFVGRKGGGPAEFMAPLRAALTASGEVVVADVTGRLTYFSPGLASVSRTQSSGLLPLYAVFPWMQDSLLLIGKHPDATPKMLFHVFHPQASRIVRSFFVEPLDLQRYAILSASAGWADVSLKEDSVAAVYMFSDTIYVLGREGEIARRVNLPAQRFRRLSTPPETGDVRTAQAFFETISHMSRILWLDSGDFLVQYTDMIGMERKHRLVRVSSTGERIFEIIDSPELLASGRGDVLYFVDPDSETPDRWISAELR